MAATRIDPGQATGQNFADRHALGSWLRASASLRAGAAPAATPTAAEASSSAMLLGSKHNAQALKSWLSQTKDLRSERAMADVEAQRGVGLKQLHVLSTAKRARSHAARMQQLTNSGVPALQPPPGTITVPMPPGFTIRTGKKISGVLDVAAPLDPDTGAAVPGIVVPNGTPGGESSRATQRKVQAYTAAGLGRSGMPQEFHVTAAHHPIMVHTRFGPPAPMLAERAAQAAALDAAVTVGAPGAVTTGTGVEAQENGRESPRQEQLAEMPSMAEDEDMYPSPEAQDAQQYDYIAQQPVYYPLPQQAQSQVYTTEGGAAVTQSVTSPWVSAPQSWEVMNASAHARLSVSDTHVCV